MIGDEAVVLVSMGSLDVGIRVSKCNAAMGVIDILLGVRYGSDQGQVVTHSAFFDDQSNLSLDLGVGDATLNAAKGRRVRTSSEDQSMLPVK